MRLWSTQSVNLSAPPPLPPNTYINHHRKWKTIISYEELKHWLRKQVRCSLSRWRYDFVSEISPEPSTTNIRTTWCTSSSSARPQCQRAPKDYPGARVHEGGGDAGWSIPPSVRRNRWASRRIAKNIESLKRFAAMTIEDVKNIPITLVLQSSGCLANPHLCWSSRSAEVPCARADVQGQNTISRQGRYLVVR